MFGKKKNKDDAGSVEAAPKGKAEGKSSAKRKNNLSKGGHGFFAKHVEKLILGVVALGVGYFVYDGFSADSYPTNRVPETLQKDSQDLMTQIRQDHWPEISAEREVVHNFRQEVASARRELSGEVFGTLALGGGSSGPAYEKRGDPELSPPEQLFAMNVFGSVATEVPKEALEPYEALEDAEPIRPKKPRSRRGNRGGAGAGGEGMGGYGSYGGEGMGSGGPGMGSGGPGMGGYGAGYGAGGEGENTPKRRMNAKYDLGAPIGGMAGGGMGMGGYGGYGGEGMGGPGGYGGEGMGSMGPGAGAGYGAGVTGGGGLGENRDRGPKTKVAAKAVFFNAITAVVPHKKMVDEYKLKFENTGPLDRRRDMPVYLSFEVQRANVTDNPAREVLEEEWKTITDGGRQFMLAKNQKWAVRPPLGRRIKEVIDRNAISPGLTMPIPPMLVRDYRKFSKHPAVGWSWDYKPLLPPRDPNQGRNRGDGQGDEGNGEDVLPGGRSGRGGAGGMGPGGGMGGPGGGGYGPGGYGGEGMGGYGSYGGEGMGGPGSYGGEGMGGYGSYGGEGMGGYGSYGGEGMGGYGSYGGEGMGGYGSYGGEGMGGYGGFGGGMQGGIYGPQPDYKMVRCYDMLPVNVNEIGKVYRYRIRLLMRDPNYPEDRTIPMPAPSDFTDEVWARVSVVMRKDDQRIEKDPKARRTLLYTEWSEPSEPVRVQAPFEVFAGNIDFAGPRNFDVNGRVYSVTTREAQAKVVVTAMDFGTGAAFAMEEDVRRGSVLSKKTDVEFIVPNTKIVKLKEDHILDSRATVADIRGGEPLAGYSRDDPQTVGGELMILHRDGRIQVTNDLDDTFLFRMYSFVDEKEAAEKAGQQDAGGPGGDGGYGGYGGGYGGDGGG